MVEYNISAHQNPNNGTNVVGVSSAVVGYVAMVIGDAVGDVGGWVERKTKKEVDLVFTLKEKYHFSKENQDALAEILQITHNNKGPTLQLTNEGENRLVVETSGGKKIHLAFQEDRFSLKEEEASSSEGVGAEDEEEQEIQLVISRTLGFRKD